MLLIKATVNLFRYAELEEIIRTVLIKNRIYVRKLKRFTFLIPTALLYHLLANL
jgi:hypothetical protein